MESRNSAIADQYPCCTHVSSAPCRQPLPSQTTRCRPLTVRARIELHKPREFRYACIGVSDAHVFHPVVALLGVQVARAARDALLHELPQLLHVFSGHDFVLDAAEEEHRRLGGDGRNLGGRVPLLVAEEGEGPEEGHGGGDEAREGKECVFEDEGADLRESERTSQLQRT